MIDLIREGIANPEKVPGYLRNNVLDRLSSDLYRRRSDIPEQKALIHQYIEQDEFAIVVLDACRYDMFLEAYDQYVSGDPSPAWSAAGWTGKYVERTWRGQYDLTYLGAATHVSDHSFELRNREYRPSEHINRIVKLWNTDWNPVYGTVHPEEVTNAALAEASRDVPTRVVVHYMQPHAPYIGDTKILPWGIDQRDLSKSIDELARESAEKAGSGEKRPGEAIEEVEPEEIDFETVVEYDLGPRQFQQWEQARPTDSIKQRIDSGAITDDMLRRAYRDNLHLVLSEVERLVARLDCPVVVTADHGEFLGENGRYFHPNTHHPAVREVPWFEVSHDCIGTTPIEEQYRDLDLREMLEPEAVDDATFKKRLEALGYVD
jgi:hypothetical protein